jgi:hypothetical protein
MMPWAGETAFRESHLPSLGSFPLAQRGRPMFQRSGLFYGCRCDFLNIG